MEAQLYRLAPEARIHAVEMGLKEAYDSFERKNYPARLLDTD
jgi:hypothetical protein